MLRLALIVCLAAVVGLPLEAAAVPKYRTKVVYYPVSGASIAQIHQRMRSPSHSGAYATIASKPDLKGRLVQGQNSCKLKGFRIPSSFTVHLPKLAGGTRIGKRSRKRFAAFQKYLRWHEFKHRSIWIGCLKRIERKARRQRAKSCGTLQSKVSAIISSEAKRCNRLNARFDKQQRKRVNNHIFVKAAARQVHRPAAARKQRAGLRRNTTPRRRSNLGASNR